MKKYLSWAFFVILALRPIACLSQDITTISGVSTYYYFYNDSTSNQSRSFRIPDDPTITAVKFSLWGAPGGRQGNDGPLAGGAAGGHGGFVGGTVVSESGLESLRGANVSINLTSSPRNGSRSGDDNDGPGENAGFSSLQVGALNLSAGGGLAGGWRRDILMSYLIFNRTGQSFPWGSLGGEWLDQFQLNDGASFVSLTPAKSPGQFDVRPLSYTAGRGGYDSKNGLAVFLAPAMDGGQGDGYSSTHIAGYVGSFYNIREGNGRSGYSQRAGQSSLTFNTNGSLADAYPQLLSNPVHVISQNGSWFPTNSAPSNTSQITFARRLLIRDIANRAYSLGAPAPRLNSISGAAGMVDVRNLTGDPRSNGSYSGLPSATAGSRQQPGYNWALANERSGRGVADAGYAAVMIEIVRDPPPPPPPVNGITYLSVGLPSTGIIGDTINFNLYVRNSGTKAFGGNHAVILREQGDSTILWSSSLDGVVIGGSAYIPFTLALPSVPGTYIYTFRAREAGVEWFGETVNGTIVLTRRPYTVSVTVVGEGSVNGAGTYFDGDDCTLVPVATTNSYFSGFTGDQIGGGATLANPSPAITFTVDRDMSITAHFSGKLPQIVSLDNPGSKPSNAPPFTLRWTTNAGTDPTGVIVSGPANIDGSELVTLDGAEGTVDVRLDFPGNTFYLPASAEVTFLVGPPVAGTVLDANAGGTVLTAAFASPTMAGTDIVRDTVGAFVNSSDTARGTIELSRLQVAGLYDPNAPVGGGGDTGGGTPGGGDTGGGSSQPPTVTVLPASGSPGEQVTYQGSVWEYTYNPSTRSFSWVRK